MKLEELVNIYKNCIETSQPFAVLTTKRRKKFSKNIRLLSGLRGTFLADIDFNTTAVKIDIEVLGKFLNKLLQETQE